MPKAPKEKNAKSSKMFFTRLLSHLMESGQAEIVDDPSASNEQGAGLGREQSKVLAGGLVALKKRPGRLLSPISPKAKEAAAPLLLKVSCSAAPHHQQKQAEGSHLDGRGKDDIRLP